MKKVLSILIILLVATILFFYLNNKHKALKGSLTISKSFSYQLKDFQISAKKATFSITNNSHKIAIKNQSFLQAAVGQENITESRGSFFIKDNITEEFSNQSIDSVFLLSETKLMLKGKLFNKNNSIAYNIIFYVDSTNTLNFSYKTDNEKINRVFLTLNSSQKEAFYGLGEQFTYLNLKGQYVPVFVSEQGIGRGKQPLSFLVDKVAKAAGTPFTSYAAMPIFYSSKNYCFSLQNTEYSAFDFVHDNYWQVSLFSSSMKGRIYFSSSLKNLVQKHAELNGKMRALPDWFHKGAIIGMQGGTQKVEKIYAQLKELNTPLAGFWLQDWVGQRKTSFGKQLWWNWQLDHSHYPQWDSLVNTFNRDSINVLLYINPFLVDVSGNKNFSKNYFKIAVENNFLIKNADGSPYLIPNTDFSAGMLDITNPKAVEWYKKIIKENIIKNGAKGWMADFGEALPFDAKLYNTENPKIYHNQYPDKWIQLNRELIDSLKKGSQYVFFSRAAYSKSMKNATMFWEGDQLVTWDKYDGIKSAVVGLLSSGLCGMTMNHSDIGGYTAIANPVLSYFRTKELLWRWIELNAFSIVFRTHEGNRPDKNYQFYNDSSSLKHFSRYAKIFSQLFTYRKLLLDSASKYGTPILRPMFFDFPNDLNLRKFSYEQYMFGNDFLIAPVLDKGTKVKKVYLPAGEWNYLWNNRIYKSSGQFFEIESKIETIPVFYKSGSIYGKNLNHFIEANHLF